MLRFGLFGAGRIGRVHAASLAAHPQTELAVVHDPVEAAALKPPLGGYASPPSSDPRRVKIRSTFHRFLPQSIMVKGYRDSLPDSEAALPHGLQAGLADLLPGTGESHAALVVRSDAHG